jgi:hypothetical protein
MIDSTPQSSSCRIERQKPFFMAKALASHSSMYKLRIPSLSRRFGLPSNTSNLEQKIFSMCFSAAVTNSSNEASLKDYVCAKIERLV